MLSLEITVILQMQSVLCQENWHPSSEPINVRALKQETIKLEMTDLFIYDYLGI